MSYLDVEHRDGALVRALLCHDRLDTVAVFTHLQGQGPLPRRRLVPKD